MDSQEQMSQYFETVEATIEEHGWACQSVMAERGGFSPGWTYTVGHEDYGRSELLMIGAPMSVACGLLNAISDEYIDSGVWLEHGELLEGYCLDGYKLRVLGVDEDLASAGEWFNVAIARRRAEGAFNALQIVWQKEDYSWPSPYDEKQPLLGSPWWY